MSAEFTALLVTDDDDEAERFVDALSDFAMAWSSNVMCAATLKMPDAPVERAEPYATFNITGVDGAGAGAWRAVEKGLADLKRGKTDSLTYTSHALSDAMKAKAQALRDAQICKCRRCRVLRWLQH